MTAEQYIEMFEQCIQAHQRNIDEQRDNLYTFNTISECIKILLKYLPQSYSDEKTQLRNLHYDIRVQIGKVLTDISKHKTEIDKLELEIQKMIQTQKTISQLENNEKESDHND